MLELEQLLPLFLLMSPWQVSFNEWFREQFQGQFQFQHQGISAAKKTVPLTIITDSRKMGKILTGTDMLKLNAQVE